MSDKKKKSEKPEASKPEAPKVEPVQVAIPDNGTAPADQAQAAIVSPVVETPKVAEKNGSGRKYKVPKIQKGKILLTVTGLAARYTMKKIAPDYVNGYFSALACLTGCGDLNEKMCEQWKQVTGEAPLMKNGIPYVPDGRLPDDDVVYKGRPEGGPTSLDDLPDPLEGNNIGG